MELDNTIKELSIENPDFTRKCTFISESIISGTLTIINLIEKLDFLLTNPLPEQRELGLKILAEVIENLPRDLLNSQQVDVISIFFINKFKDHHQVVPVAIKGLLNLLQMKNYPPEHVPLLLTTMMDNIACQQQQQADRYNIYKLFEILMRDFTKELVSMGLDFTYAVIRAIDGERDPRNLLFLFKLMNKYLKIIPLGHLIEDMFDVLSCYFPVDFKTPPNNVSVTREHLAEGLCPCLCAVPEFGEPCIELALEKLDSSLQIAKYDSLELLKAGCKNFNSETYLMNSYKIWSQLQKEIFTSSDVKLQQLSLETLTHITNKMSQSNEEEFKKFICDVLDSLKGNLLPEMKSYQISISILLHIARGSSVASALIIEEVVPILINTFNIAPTQHKPIILRAAVAFLKAYLTQNHSENSILLDNIMSLCLQSISDHNEDLRHEVFDSFSTLALYLPKNIREILYKTLAKCLVIPESISVRKAYNNCLLELSKYYQNEILEIVSQVTLEDSRIIDLHLASLCTLATLDGFREVLATFFVKYINQSTDSACVVVKSLKHFLEMNDFHGQHLNIFIQKNFIGILLEFSINHISNVSFYTILPDVASVIQILIGSQGSMEQKVILDHWLNELLNGLVTQEHFVILLDGLIGRLNRNVDIYYQVTDKLFNIALCAKDSEDMDIAVQLLANVINKKETDDEYEEHLKLLKNKLEHCLELNQKNAFVTMFWITKALMMKNYSKGLDWLSMVLSSLELNAEAADGFKIIMDDTHDCSKSKCIKVPLYQQKVFVFVVDKMLSNFSQVTKQQYMKTFGYILGYAPEEVVLIHFKKMSSLILLCLEHLDNGEILLLVLQSIKTIIRDDKSKIEDQLEDYVNRILKLTQFENSMKIRIEALQLITNIVSTFTVYKLLPLKGRVLNELSQCVDDKKRLVRKEAMEARSLWFLLDSPM